MNRISICISITAFIVDQEVTCSANFTHETETDPDDLNYGYIPLTWFEKNCEMGSVLWHSPAGGPLKNSDTLTGYLVDGIALSDIQDIATEFNFDVGWELECPF